MSWSPQLLCPVEWADSSQHFLHNRHQLCWLRVQGSCRCQSTCAREFPEGLGKARLTGVVGAVRDTGTRARTGLLLVVFQKKAGPQSTALLSLCPPSLRLNEQVWGGGRVSGLPCADPRALGQMPEKVRPLSQIQGAVRVFSGYGEGGWSVLGLVQPQAHSSPSRCQQVTVTTWTICHVGLKTGTGQRPLRPQGGAQVLQE